VRLLSSVQDLAPGDVVSWLKTADSRSTNTGHTMIVHGAPVADPARPGWARSCRIIVGDTYTQVTGRT
jgi:hypothetical protein